MIAKVVVEIGLDRQFDYRIPRELDGAVQVGSRVIVPFGRATQAACVVALAETSQFERLKDILSVIGTKPYVAGPLLELAHWVAEYYCAPVEQAVRAVLPGAVRNKEARFKRRTMVTLLATQEKVQRAVAAAPGEPDHDRKLTDKQKLVLKHLTISGPVELAQLTAALEITAVPVRSLAKRDWLTITHENVRRDPMGRHNILRTTHLELMPEQASALAAIRECGASAARGAGTGRREPSVLLLHGVTGSGKTEVYLQSIDEFLQAGKGAIVLVPEIALTPQTVERFVGRFGPRVAVLHSHLSEGERHDEWHRIHEGEAQIVVGARSAVFAPVRNLGLIVVDEEHEPSYKQDETPRYNARDVAVMRGHIERCAVVLGSATPSLESWRNAQTGKYRLATLPRRADNCRMPHVEVVDMRIETERTGHASVFSRELAEAIHQRLQKKEQTMLFLNRRGFATSLVCPKCGFVAKCDFCSVTLTYHKTDDHLRCHVCGSSRKAPARCPACADPAFKFSGVGTQRVETVAQKFFPHARIQRMDTDVTGAKDAYERILGDFRAGKIDILIGTQMIAKGLHFPNVTLVGVVYADLSLHMPDFRAGERTFQLLLQVAGRAGRGDVPGAVIVQTYTPFHVAVQAARRSDYVGFCDQELEFRRELKYPPFGHLVCITLRGLSEERTAFYTESLAKAVQPKLGADVILSEPSPAPLARAKGYYRFQIMLRHPSTRAMTVPLRETLRTFKVPDDISLVVDVDALSTM